jgi:hypothetical protein
MRSSIWLVIIGVLACGKTAKNDDVASDKLTVVGPAGTVQASGNAQSAHLQLTNDSGTGSVNVSGGQTHITGKDGKTVTLPGLP